MTVEENMTSGNRALQRVIKNHADAKNAMYREDIGNIDFVWGFAGVGKKFKRGYGVAHILAKHVPESGENLLHHIVDTIAQGKITVRQAKKESTQSRVLIEYKGYTALLSLGEPPENAWLLTGWENFSPNVKKEASNANGEGNGSTVATATTPMRSRRDGADASNVNPSITHD